MHSVFQCQILFSKIVISSSFNIFSIIKTYHVMDNISINFSEYIVLACYVLYYLATVIKQ